MLVRCEGCGTEISARTKNRRFCTNDCRRKLARREARMAREKQEKTCPICHKPFLVDNIQKVYCSVQCKNRAYYRSVADKRQRLAEPRFCLNCGKPIDQFARRTQKFCHRNCASAFHRHGKTLPQKACAYCKELFTPRNLHQKYCTEWCNKASRKKGENTSPHAEGFRKTSGRPLPDMERGLREAEKEARRLNMSYGKYKAMLYMQEIKNGSQNSTKHNLSKR